MNCSRCVLRTTLKCYLKCTISECTTITSNPILNIEYSEDRISCQHQWKARSFTIKCCNICKWLLGNGLIWFIWFIGLIRLIRLIKLIRFKFET